MVKTGAKRVSVPVALNLDHGSSIEDAEKCINAGFTAVMIDASHEDYEENIRMTAEVVKMQRTYGASLSEEETRIIGAYLAVAYGSAKATDASITDVSAAPVPVAGVAKTDID